MTLAKSTKKPTQVALIRPERETPGLFVTSLTVVKTLEKQATCKIWPIMYLPKSWTACDNACKLKCHSKQLLMQIVVMWYYITLM